MIASFPALTEADTADMLRRALSCAPNLFDDDAVVEHLHRLGFSITNVSSIVWGLLDEARAQALAQFTTRGTHA